MKDLILIPRVSEKAYGMSQNPGQKTYVFMVPTDANKHSIARAITAQYDVAVTSVRTTMLKGKAKQSYRKGQRPVGGKRIDIKKAYITLREGAELPLFVEEAAEEEKAVKAAEKAAKKAEKESK